MQYRLGEVKKTCGLENLYYEQGGGGDPMRIEHLLNKLEGRASSVFQKIVDDVAQDSTSTSPRKTIAFTKRQQLRKDL
ncbi:hypothetical protein PG993_005921 [Apiospora rasikravindrae]|uniref:Uncharacterized protein n=1 Tax=Apiospora rasikravindrae TaxID=990691 RepID=A0ABR1TBX1_9PEZI